VKLERIPWNEHTAPGEIIFGAAGGEYRLGPGDRLMLPAGTVHTAHAGGRGALYLIGERR
jgi:quercetin dioxygenase-like cupin family protein